VLETQDGGANWRIIELGIEDWEFYGLAVDNNTPWIVSRDHIYSKDNERLKMVLSKYE
jgi:hypothetical protein